jgi:hypothetical protein
MNFFSSPSVAHNQQYFAAVRYPHSGIAVRLKTTDAECSELYDARQRARDALVEADRAYNDAWDRTYDQTMKAFNNG